jgi:hypothetical protein
LLYLIAAWGKRPGHCRDYYRDTVTQGYQQRVYADPRRHSLNFFGVALIANPAAGALEMIWIIGAYALVFGVMMIVLAFRLHGLSVRLERLGAQA